MDSSRDQAGDSQVQGLMEAKPLQPHLGTYREKTAHFKPRNNNKINCFLEWTVLNYRIWEVVSVKGFVMMMNGEESLWGEDGASYNPNSV